MRYAAFNIRSFLINGALCMGIVGSMTLALAGGDKAHSLLGNRVSALGFFQFFVVGGIGGIIVHFVRTRRVQILLSTLILVAGTFATYSWISIERTRYAKEEMYVSCLQKSLGGHVEAVRIEGWSGFRYVTGLIITDVDLTSGRLCPFVSTIRIFPRLRYVSFRNVKLKAEGLSDLRRSVPDVNFGFTQATD